MQKQHSQLKEKKEEDRWLLVDVLLFLVTQDKGSMSLPYEQFKQKKRKRKETVINYHLLCTCAGVR